MSTTTLFRAATLTVAAAGLAAAAWTGTAIGHAETGEYPYTRANAVTVCDAMTEYGAGTAATVFIITAAQEGLDTGKTGRTLAHMVKDQCPQHIPALLQWADEVTK